ncbi:(d)CMP kinase [soil metagenome]
MIIAIDGPAGSGKSSTARAVARALGFTHLDSGAFYRALTCAALRADIPVEQWGQLDAARLDTLAVSAELAGNGFRMRVAGRDVGAEIRAPDLTAGVAAMARVPAVRDWLLDRLRAVGRSADVVADGRDIGTVVFPEAEVKVFLIAEPRTRARRRLQQMVLPHDDEAVGAEMQRIEERDRADSSRDIAPLRAAEDAILLDTTDLDFQAQVARIVGLARRQLE